MDSGTPDNELVQQIAPGLARAREQAGLPAAAATSPGTALATSVSGTVTLAPALARQARTAARRRTAGQRSAAAKKAARTRARR